MGTITVDNAHNLPDPGFGGVAYGNMVCLKFHFETNASGVIAASNQATAVQIADVVRLGVLPAGMTLIDAICVVTDASTAASTFDLGFAYKDGVDVTAAAQDADYFMDAGDWNSAAARLVRNEPVATITIPKDAYLTLTNNTAALDEVTKMDIFIIGIIGGPH
jgi:hypothetical protein